MSASVPSGTTAAVPAMSAAAPAAPVNVPVATTLPPAPTPTQAMPVPVPAPVVATGMVGSGQPAAGAQKQMRQDVAEGVAAAAGPAGPGFSEEAVRTRNITERMAE